MGTYLVSSAAHQEGKRSKLQTTHFSAASASSTLRRHIARMGGEHWALYLKQCMSLEIAPDEGATPRTVLEEQKDGKELVLLNCNTVRTYPLHLLVQTTDATVNNASRAFMAQLTKLCHGLWKACSVGLRI